MIKDTEEPVEEDDENLIKFINALLTYCGDCVQKGYMRPFEGKYRDPRTVKRKLENSEQHSDMLKSIAQLREISHLTNNVFERSSYGS